MTTHNHQIKKDALRAPIIHGVMCFVKLTSVPEATNMSRTDSTARTMTV
jgi:catabolite regulation protein CreA